MQSFKSNILDFSRSTKLKAKFQNIAPNPSLSETEIKPCSSSYSPAESNYVQSVLDLLPDLDPELIKVI